ncbi:hypothetical protein IV203_008311 [Nitzschia inconspicua]|uniref:Uncharacterized protein n=1 Tax=Nitzschia inconspicua TaxID=303405 RepID=A0A9K3KZR9_9STRA|nr:hypothetical protein IV203_008311 [Nitzschia inconspicua]
MGSTVSSVPGARGLSAEERWNIIETVTNEYFEFLSNNGGFALTAEQRVHIATLTLNGTLDCPACAQLPKESCLKPGTDLYEAIATGHEQVDDDDAVLLHMIHSIVNHQSKISQDPDWYHSTMTKLRSTKTLLDETRMKNDGLVSQQQREYLEYGLFVEIAMVTAAVHCLHMVTIMKGNNEPSPKPIAANKDATPPSYLDWSKIFKSGKGATVDLNKATMPYISRSDIDENSPSLLKLLPVDQHREILFSTGMLPMAPFLCTTWDPIDFLWMERLDDALYVAVEDFFAPHKALNPKFRCAEHFSRRDIETVATAVSKGYNCGF